MAKVPIRTGGLSWAIDESGYTDSDIESKLKITNGTIDLWRAGTTQPNKTQFKKLKTLLKRPAAIFFMDEPPPTTEPEIALRFALGAVPQSRSPEERLAIRDASLMRDFVREVWHDMARAFEALPSASLNDDPEQVGERVRSDLFRVSVDEQLAWTSISQAFKTWRTFIEQLGILVFLYPIGLNSARGFSLVNEIPAVIGVSTSWDYSVRIYTLIHELGHLLTRTSSSCLEGASESPSDDAVERWCESFSASFLMPRVGIQEFLAGRPSTAPIATATSLANRFKVSRKAALLRLIELNHAKWSDFRRFDSNYEKRKPGGRYNPERVRTRADSVRHKYGSCVRGIHDAYVDGFLSEYDIRSYLRVVPDELV